jgi:DNA polymerase III subunit alpha
MEGYDKMSIAPLWDGLTPKPQLTFADLHIHTEYSLKDAMIRILDQYDSKHNKGQLVINAERRNMGFITATDHGNMYGQAQIASQAKKYGLKHAPACEFYLAPQSRFDKNAPKGTTIYHHMCGWAKNKKGYANLCTLQKLSYTEGFYNRPRIDRELLDKYGDDIIWSDGCIAGPISLNIVQDKEQVAMEWFKWLTDRFKDDFYMEYQNHGIADEDKANSLKTDWANQYGVPIIATTDSHFTNKDDEDAHRTLLCIQWGKWFDDPTFSGFSGDGYWLMNDNELLARFPVEYLNNTKLIADKVEENIIEFGKVTPPVFQVPDQFLQMIGGK